MDNLSERKCCNCKHHEIHKIYMVTKNGEKSLLNAECMCSLWNDEVHSDSCCHVEINGECVGDVVDCPLFEE